jgi:hypothetical protein
MTEKRKRKPEELTEEEVEEANAEPLPDREAMTILKPPLPVPEPLPPVYTIDPPTTDV